MKHANPQLHCCARLWQFQLEQCFPMWSSAGIYPVSGRQDGQTWKQLVVTASKIPAGRPDIGTIAMDENRKQLWNSGIQHTRLNLHHSLSKTAAIVASCLRLHDLTNPAGKQKVQLDFQLCYAEYRASCWVLVPGHQFWKIQHTTLLLELVYFFWFEERQLARGAKMLAKVMFTCIFVAGSLSSIRQ